MAYEMKEGDFSLFKNEKKDGDNQPDYTGKIMVNGRQMRMAAWIKKGEKGAFFTGKISEYQQKSSDPVDDPLNPTAPVELGPLEDNSPPPAEKPKRTKKETEEQAGDLPF